MFDLGRLQASLPIQGLGEPFFFHRKLGSTNERAGELAKDGSPHGTLVLADEQTAGRGRGGKKWFTSPKSGLAMSLVLRPGRVIEGAHWRLTALGALGVVESLKELGVEAQIKWPNDVLVAGRKAAGILVEAIWIGDQLKYAILGIGINVRKQSLPDELETDYPATYVEAVLGKRVDRTDLLLAVLLAVGRWYGEIGSELFIEAWERNLALRGQEVIVRGGAVELRGEIEGLSPEGRLRLLTNEGEIITVGSQEAQLRPVDMALE